MQKLSLSLFMVMMTIFSLNLFFINNLSAGLPPDTPLFACENIQVEAFVAEGYYKIQWEVDCFGYCNTPTQVGLDKYWSIIPWENCTNSNENTVITLFLKADRYRSCDWDPNQWNPVTHKDGDWDEWGNWTDHWEQSTTITSSPNAAFWIKIWDDSQQCAGDNCDSQWSLDLTQDKNGKILINDQEYTDYFIYHTSFVFNRDQYFCYEPLLNKDAEDLTAAWVGSSWCGNWHPVTYSCPEGGFQP